MICDETHINGGSTFMKIWRRQGSHTLLLAGVFVLLAASTRSAEASVLYHVDELGTLVNHDDIAVSLDPNPPQVDLWWANQFDVQPGGERITQIGLSFGSSLTVGGPISLLVYNDPNNDGDPTDAVLLSRFDTTILESDSNFDEPTFFDISPTVVTGTFFIAAMLLDVPGNAGMTFHNEPGESLGRSWLGVSTTNPGTFDPADVAGSSVDLAPATIDSLGAPGNWVLRAIGEPIPEPASLAVLSLGGLLTLGRRRKA